MFKRQRHIIFKALHVSQNLNLSSETARFETFVNISLGGSTEPPLDPPLDSRWLLQFHCLPASHQFLDNFAWHQVAQGGFITHTHTLVQPLPQFHANRLKKKMLTTWVQRKCRKISDCYVFFFFFLQFFVLA